MSARSLVTVAWSVVAAAALAAPALAGGLGGMYSGTHPEHGALRMVLDQQGDEVMGVLETGGMLFIVEAWIEGNGAFGDILLDDDDESHDRIFTLTPTGTGATLTLFVEDDAGDPVPGTAMEIALKREAGYTAPADPAPEPGAEPPSRTDSPAGAGFAGQWQATWQGGMAGLALEQDGATLGGQIQVGGMGYLVQGQVAGSDASGILMDPNTGESAEFRAVREQDKLLMTLILVDPNTGMRQEIPIPFEPYQEPKDTGGGDEGPVERDPALVGRWSSSESMSSGDFTMASRTTLIVNPDGTYVLGDSQIAGGGGAGSFGSGPEGVGATGRWKTQNRIVYIQEPGTPQYVPYARYYVEGYKLMFTFGDGSRQIWKRF